MKKTATRNRAVTALKKIGKAMLLDEIHVNSAQHSYRFYLTARPGGATSRQYITGQVREKGEDFVRVRQSSGYREHVDILIPLSSILYVQESYSAE